MATFTSVTFNIIGSPGTSALQEQKVLMIGQKTSAGTASVGLNENIPSDGSANSLFGTKSMLAHMTRSFKELNTKSRLDAYVFNDHASGVAATGSITFNGTATEAGVLTVVVGSERNNSYEISLAVDDASDTLVTSLVAAIEADAFAMVSADDGGVVANPGHNTINFTALNDGSFGNEIPIRVYGSIAGITFSTAPFTGGANDPALTNLFTDITRNTYQTIIFPTGWDTQTLVDELDARFNVSNNVKSGIGFQGVVELAGDLIDEPAYEFNCKSLVFLANRAISWSDKEGGAIVEHPDVITSQVAALRALRLTDDANLTRYLTTTAPKDQFGGAHLATLPYANTLMPLLPVPKISDFYTDDDLDGLTDSGFSYVLPNGARNAMVMGDFVTNYLTDNAGNPDDSWKYLNTVDAEMVIREFFFNNYKSRFAQTRLTGGDLVIGRDMVNAGSIRAFSISLYKNLADLGIVESGDEAVADFDENLSIEVSVREGSATIYMAPLLVGQLRLVIGTIQVKFSS